MVGKDLIGPFHSHGFVDSVGRVWFVQLYRHHGRLYRGQVDTEKGVLRGSYGSKRQMFFGKFTLQRKG